MKLLFCVHRYFPYPGGSEYYVQAMAEEALLRGHQVAVFAGEHQGNQNGIRVSSDANILLEKWDLILVHGGDVGLQNYVLSNANHIQSKIVYMIVKPSYSAICLQAIKDCDYVSYSTLEDIEYLKNLNAFHKGVQIRHGIKHLDSLGTSNFKTKYNIHGPMFLSCGGYWPNKALPELAAIFEEYGPKNSTLVLTGYDNRYGLMPNQTSRVKPLMINDKKDVMSAISEAEALIMHSTAEGFGLVLLEAMINKTPWIAREIAGAKLLKNYGDTYTTDHELINIFTNWCRSTKVDLAYDYVMNNHLISNTVSDIEAIV
jgi:glycosyltransferase involved in cell wall biosynthesis